MIDRKSCVAESHLWSSLFIFQQVFLPVAKFELVNDEHPCILRDRVYANKIVTLRNHSTQSTEVFWHLDGECLALAATNLDRHLSVEFSIMEIWIVLLPFSSGVLSDEVSMPIRHGLINLLLNRSIDNALSNWMFHLKLE